MSKRQSLSTFSSENFSDGDGDEGHTSEPSHSATPDVGSTNTDERPDDRSEDLLSQGSEIPLDAAPPEGPGRRLGGLSPTKVRPPGRGSPGDGPRGVGGVSEPLDGAGKGVPRDDLQRVGGVSEPLSWGWQRGSPAPPGPAPAPFVSPGLRGLGL